MLNQFKKKKKYEKIPLSAIADRYDIKLHKIAT